MTWHSGYNLNQNQGGEFNMSMAYLAAWKGPVYEEDDPYGDGYSPDGLEPAFHVQEMQIIESKNLTVSRRRYFCMAEYRALYICQSMTQVVSVVRHIIRIPSHIVTLVQKRLIMIL